MHHFPRLQEAVDYAAESHRTQSRKGTDIPYLAHLLGVCSLVLDYGGDEDQAIAGLLHDVIEDHGAEHEWVIRGKFGDQVAEIVLGCTDGVPDEKGKKADWMERKQAYLHHLRDAEAATLLVSGCDKLHNARAIAADVRLVGVSVFDRFSVSREKTLWYYGELLDVFATRLGHSHGLVIELGVAVAGMSV